MKEKIAKGFQQIHNDLNISFIVLIILKGAGLVNWSYWIIMSPYLARLAIYAIEGFIEGIFESEYFRKTGKTSK